MNEQNFKLAKVKLNPGGGLKASYSILTSEGVEPSGIERDESRSNAVHPDLLNLFDKCRRIIGDIFGVTAFLPMLEQIEVPGEKVSVAKSWAEERLEKIDVRGISWSGADTRAAVVLTAVYETPNGQKTAINTPRILLGGESFGFEEDLKDITDAIRNEVYRYLFEGKQAQMSLFGDESEKSE